MNSFGAIDLGSIVAMLPVGLAKGFDVRPGRGLGSFCGKEEETLGCTVDMLGVCLAIGFCVEPGGGVGSFGGVAALQACWWRSVLL